MWFDLKGDARLGRCATDGCGGQPTFRLEADGVGSNYCSGCQAKIVAASACRHTVQRGREGEKGSWCEECGVKAMEVHDRECRDCESYKPDSERVGICKRHLMRVTADMHVTYWLIEGPGRSGLCFKERADRA